MILQIELRVLHLLRCKGFGTTEEIHDLVPTTGTDVHVVLKEFEVAGLVKSRQSPRSGWLLTDLGRQEGERLLQNELEATGKRDAIFSQYQGFLLLNKPFLQLCSDWQTKTVDGAIAVNDHNDKEYDAAVIDQLRELHPQICRISSELTKLLERFGPYRPRFEAALVQIDQGDIDWFTKPIIDSYHTIWFELHEDLLATLNLERTHEGTL